MYINYVWAGDIPNPPDNAIHYPIQLKTGLNTRALSEPGLYNHRINFWCFDEFVPTFRRLFQNENMILNPARTQRTPGFGIQIDVRSIETLLNSTNPEFGIDAKSNNYIKYCLAVCIMIKSFNLIKELIVPLILIRFPGFYVDTTLEFIVEKFCFPEDGMPKIPLREGMGNISLYRISRYTQKNFAPNSTQWAHFKRNLKAIRKHIASRLPVGIRDIRRHIASQLPIGIRDIRRHIASQLPPIDIYEKVSFPLFDVWFIFCPDTKQAKELFSHLAKALYQGVLDRFPVFCSPSSFDRICQNYKDPTVLEHEWQTRGALELKHLLKVKITQGSPEAKTFTTLSTFYGSVNLLLSTPHAHMGMVAALILNPYCEIFYFLFAPNQLVNPFLEPYDASSSAEERTILKYGIVKRFGRTGWRKRPAFSEKFTLLFSEIDPQYISRQRKYAIVDSPENDPTFKLFIDYLNNPAT